MVHDKCMQLLDWIIREKSHSHSRPFIVGLSGPQGSGKTTLSLQVCEQARSLGLHAVTVSIDDFYLSRSEQVKLAEHYREIPYLQYRGYPLTHDIELGLKTLRGLKAVNDQMACVRVPRYDKSAYDGRGDSFPEIEWPKITAPLDIVILEGWMLGFQPVAAPSLPGPSFQPINAALPRYNAWLNELDAFIWIEPNEINDIVGWRIEAEENMKATGKPGMSREETRDYIERFIPAYQTYLPGFLEKLPFDRAVLHLKVDRKRNLQVISSSGGIQKA